MKASGKISVVPEQGIKSSQQRKCYSYVRFSSAKQEMGDSLRRQTAMSEKWAADHGMAIDTTVCFHDKGVSAFKGDNKTKGMLGEFLKLVKEGRIPKGSFLLVESLDRLSRQDIYPSLAIFLEIIVEGITIVTLTDGMEYTNEKGSDHLTQLIISLTIMSRAHEESMMKSRRGRASWEKKQADALEKIVTATCPLWLKPSADRTHFEKRDEACLVVNRIFKMKVHGKGNELIAKELNQDAAAWKPGKGWRKTYIMKILNNRATIGEYQPHQKIDGVRKPVGDPVLGYYPRVIPSPLFYQVQEINQRQKRYPGRIGRLANLFAHLVKCGYCGASMVYVHKGRLPHEGNYLICDNERRGFMCDPDRADYTCKKNSMRCEVVEDAVLTFCKGLKAADILPSNDGRKSLIAKLRAKASSIPGQIKAVDERLAGLMDLVVTAKDNRNREMFQVKMSEEQDKKAALVAEGKEIDQQLEQLVRAEERVDGAVASVHKLMEVMKRANERDRFEIRIRLKAELKLLIDRIDILRFGTYANLTDSPPSVHKVMDVQSQVGLSYIDKAKFNASRQLHIHFKNGGFRKIIDLGMKGRTPRIGIESSEEGVASWRRESDGTIKKRKHVAR